MTMAKRAGVVLILAMALAAPALLAQQGRGGAPAGGQQAADPDIPTALQSVAMPWPPLHVYIRAGLKTHGPGAHDYPQFLADWSKLLTERGAIVDGGFHFPTTAELSGVNVMVMYKGDAGYMSADERATLAYDMWVIAILAFVWLTPPDWLRDPTASGMGLVGIFVPGR